MGICAKNIGAKAGNNRCPPGSFGGALITRRKKLSKYSRAYQRPFDLIGVAGFVHGCAQERYPRVFARVTRYIGWIKKHASGNWCSSYQFIRKQMLKKLRHLKKP